MRWRSLVGCESLAEKAFQHPFRGAARLELLPTNPEHDVLEETLARPIAVQTRRFRVFQRRETEPHSEGES